MIECLDLYMGLPAQIDLDWKMNHTSLNRSGPRSTHVRVKVAMNLAQIPAKRWQLGRRRHHRRERIGSRGRGGARGGVGEEAAGAGVQERRGGTAEAITCCRVDAERGREWRHGGSGERPRRRVRAARW